MVCPSESSPSAGPPGAESENRSIGGVARRPHGSLVRALSLLNWQVHPVRASTWLSFLSVILVAAAVAIHVPGQLSMDTSIQLEEARVGRSLSFNPPFMSALLRWLGGGEIATAMFVLFCSVATYGALAIACRTTLARRLGYRGLNVSAWRISIASLLFLNPVLFVYLGIVWKDVLFASVLMAGTAAAYAAWACRGWTALGLAIGSWAILAIGMDIRQQGLFMSPCLALVPLAALAGNPAATRLPRWSRMVLGLTVFLAVLTATRAAVRATISPNENIPPAFGYQVVMDFDLAGIVCKSPLPTPELAVPITEAQRAEVRSSHGSDRIDKVRTNPLATAWLDSLADGRFHYWLAMVRQNPVAYARHRMEAFGFLLGFRGVGPCLPLCIGVEGNPSFLERAGIEAVRDARDLLLYRIAATYFNWPIYRHWFWFLLLAGAGSIVWRMGPASPIFPMAWPIAAACLLLYLSYIPTAIACDFRYLFPAIPLVSLLCCVLLLGDARAPGASRTSDDPAACFRKN